MADDYTGEEIYCICRSTDISRFMIGCDNCDEWFHGDCIGLQAEEANSIESFFCHLCRKKNPTLKVIYKKVEKHHKHKDKHRDKDKHREKERPRDKDKHRDRERHREEHEKYKPKPQTSEFESFLKKIKTEKSTIQKHKEREAHQKNVSKDKKSRRCGSCEGCLRLDDCGKCQVCKEKRLGVLPRKQKCRKRRCSAFGASKEEFMQMSKAEEPPSPKHKASPPAPKHKVPSSSPKARPSSPKPKIRPPSPKPKIRPPSPKPKIRPPSPKPRARPLSPKPRARPPSPKLRTEPPSPKLKTRPPSPKPKYDPPPPKVATPPPKPRASTPPPPPPTSTLTAMAFKIPKHNNPKIEPILDVTKSDAESSDEYKSEDESTDPFFKSPFHHKVDTKRQFDEDESDSDWAGPSPKKSKKKPSKKIKKKGRGTKRAYNKRGTYKKKEVYSYEEYAPYAPFPTYSSYNSYSHDLDDDEPRQCYGPNCTEPARHRSKYCSDDCGLKLATSRIFEILPARIQNWHSSPCQAEEADKVSLERVRRDQLKARQKVEDLERKQKQLSDFISKVKQFEIAEATDSQEDDTDTELQTIFCVTCGHEVGQKTALKHMEKCFQKFETLTAFGSTYPSRIEGNIFCDAYHASSGTYCKRLKVLCPEHSKEPRASLEEVCGCPLQTKQFKDTGEVCRNAKRKCNKHPCWERMRRAEIDLERLRQWMKLEELFDKERNIRTAMSNRAGVLSLLLHQTIDHDAMKPILKTAN